MHRTGLEFDPRTTDDCKRLVGKLFPDPKMLLAAYRNACAEFGTLDIVLHRSDQNEDIHGGSRLDFCEKLRGVWGARASEFAMWRHSAQSVMKLPSDSEAMWLVVDVRGVDLPVMCVIYAVPYAIEATIH